MRPRAIALCVLGVLVCVPLAADTIVFKDGTTKKVRVYRSLPDYVLYIADGRIEVSAREKIKELKIEGELVSEAELAEVFKKLREELRGKVREEEVKSGIQPGKEGEVKVIDSKDPGKGVKVIEKDKSKTNATELRIDPFPEHPVNDKKPKGETKPPAKVETK